MESAVDVMAVTAGGTSAAADVSSVPQHVVTKIRTIEGNKLLYARQPEQAGTLRGTMILLAALVDEQAARGHEGRELVEQHAGEGGLVGAGWSGDADELAGVDAAAPEEAVDPAAPAPDGGGPDLVALDTAPAWPAQARRRTHLCI